VWGKGEKEGIGERMKKKRVYVVMIVVRNVSV
jgi:hypothetical protein